MDPYGWREGRGNSTIDDSTRSSLGPPDLDRDESHHRATRTTLRVSPVVCIHTRLTDGGWDEVGERVRSVKRRRSSGPAGSPPLDVEASET